ncbi:MAG: sucrose-6-phosphate hydrolase [Eubacterium sp.]|nr:sucrose-6-phosphate hydrolase [Eubacterium sp.]
MREWTREEKYRVLKDADEIIGMRDKITASDYRQTFHIQPPTGLLNDPNGFIYHNGYWHLFYQWCPWGAIHGMKHWYHTVSRDLVNWKNLGVAIKPDTEYDNKGAYSGSAYPMDDEIYLFYSGNHRDEDWTRISYTCVAKLEDSGSISKPDKPVFSPSPLFSSDQRDPKIIYNEKMNKYFIVIGARTKDGRGTALIYESDSLLKDWEYKGEMKIPGFEAFGGMWECPAVEHIGDKDVFIFCPQHLKLPGRGETTNHNGYIIGEMDWESLTFTPEGKFHVLDFGFDSYAAECATKLDDNGKAVLVAWMGLPDSTYYTDEEEWAGCLTLARELTIRNRRLIQTPLPYLASLRDEEYERNEGFLPSVCEMEIEVPADSDEKELSFRLFTDKDGNGGIHIHFDKEKSMFTVDRSGLIHKINPDQGEIREHIIDNPLTSLHIFIDRSSIEIFVNDGDAVFTSRVFPTDEEHNFILPDSVKCRLWTLKPSVKDDFVI